MKGGGGSKFNDRILAGQVRNLALSQMKAILEGNDEAYKKELLLKISSSLLPRLNEVSGPEGEPLVISVSKEILEKNGLNS